MRSGLGLAAVVVVAGCSPPAFECAAAAACDAVAGGRCEAGGLCSYPTAGCASGRAYGDSAGSLAGVCVGQGGGGDGGAPDGAIGGIDASPGADGAVGSSIAVTPLTGDSSTTDGEAFVTGQIAVSAGRPVVIDVHSDAVASGDDQVPLTVTGAGLSFTRVAQLLGPDTAYLTLSRWVALPISDDVGDLTIAFSLTQDNVVWSVYAIDGAGPLVENGTAIFVQHKAETAAGDSMALMLAQVEGPANAVVAAYSAENQSGSMLRTATPEAGWTEIFDGGESADNYSEAMETQYRVGDDATPSVTWTGTGELGGLASEIHAAP